MGTYHSSDVSLKPLSKDADIREILNTLLDNPKLSLAATARKFKVSGSTIQTWIAGPEHLKLNETLISWLAEDNNMARWLSDRPRNTLGNRVMYAVTDYKEGQEPEPEPEPDSDRLIGPSGIGTFVPGATDDLLVIKQEALDVKAEAESVAQSATELAIAIDTVRDWMGTTDRLQLALGRIQNLEAQLREQDEIVKRFRQQKLATNQVHSTD